jgi:hypothetical protein
MHASLQLGHDRRPHGAGGEDDGPVHSVKHRLRPDLCIDVELPFAEQ